LHSRHFFLIEFMLCENIRFTFSPGLLPYLKSSLFIPKSMGWRVDPASPHT